MLLTATSLPVHDPTGVRRAASFADPLSIAALLADFDRPWFFCGGWAIDLFLGQARRPHKDVDVALVRSDQLAAQAYLLERGWTLEKAVDGQLVPWTGGEFIALPVHTIWCRHATYKPDFLELLLNDTDGGSFLFRRDRSITLPLERMALRSVVGLPILAPEIVLLYKAKSSEQTENSMDFAAVLPALDADQRAWLHAGLSKLHPGHPWLEQLRGEDRDAHLCD
jgi:Aminoglycoside-2''-adenylyltransferase